MRDYCSLLLIDIFVFSKKCKISKKENLFVPQLSLYKLFTCLLIVFLVFRLIPAGRWWCSLRVGAPGRSICSHWRKSSRWTPPLNLSYIQTRMDSGGFSVFLQVSTRSRTGILFKHQKSKPPISSQICFFLVAKGHLKAVSVFERFSF